MTLQFEEQFRLAKDCNSGRHNRGKEHFQNEFIWSLSCHSGSLFYHFSKRSYVPRDRPNLSETGEFPDKLVPVTENLLP